MRTRVYVLRASAVAMAAVLVLIASPAISARPLQTQSPKQASGLTPPSPSESVISSDPGDVYFKEIYREFYNTYKLGAEDQIALRVFGQPDYSLEQVTISPLGRIYHPLLGELDVVGMTIPKLTARLTIELGQYILDPKVTVSLISANSAKIGVLGDVNHPGVVLMARPMTVLDAISASGGISDLGNKSEVSVLRQVGGTRSVTRTVNVKRILQGKADAEENMTLQAGDTIIVHGNTRKKIASITSMLGFAHFLGFLRGF